MIRDCYSLKPWKFAGLLAAGWACVGGAQVPPYDVRPQAEPPYYRVRYEPSAKPGELSVPVTYTAWLPEGVKSLRGVLVHQHGCGEGSCKSGLIPVSAPAFDVQRSAFLLSVSAEIALALSRPTSVYS